jgi:hypothetical protein
MYTKSEPPSGNLRALWAKTCGAAHNTTATANHEFRIKVFIRLLPLPNRKRRGDVQYVTVNLDRISLELEIDSQGRLINFATSCKRLQPGG